MKHHEVVSRCASPTAAIVNGLHGLICKPMGWRDFVPTVYSLIRGVLIVIAAVQAAKPSGCF